MQRYSIAELLSHAGQYIDGTKFRFIMANDENGKDVLADKKKERVDLIRILESETRFNNQYCLSRIVKKRLKYLKGKIENEEIT